MIPRSTLPLILVVDIETTDLSPLMGSIIEIGAHWLTGPREGQEFEAKCRTWVGAQIDATAMEINGADWLGDPTVASESEALEDFLIWVGDDFPILAGMNPRFDLDFLRAAFARRWSGYEQKPRLGFPHRTLDMHSLAIAWAMAADHEIPAGGLHTDHILSMLGLPEEPKPHRALRGARCEAEAFRVLLGYPNTLAEASLT